MHLIRRLTQCLGFPGGSDGKESACTVGDVGSIPGSGRFPEEGNGYLLQYSGLENSMDCRVHGVAKSWTRLSDFHSLTLSVCHKLPLHSVAPVTLVGALTAVSACGLPFQTCLQCSCFSRVA